MQDFRDGTFKPLVSEVAERELENAPEVVQRRYAELLIMGADILRVDTAAIQLADEYQ